MDFKDIEILSYNSLFCSHLIAHFVSGSENHRVRTELVFLLLPFIFKKEARNILASSNKSSTLNSAFLSDTNKKIALAGLEIRQSHFHNITQSSLVVAANDFQIQIDEYLEISNAVDYNDEKEPYLKEFFKAAHYLGKILSKNDIFDTFIKLGLKEI